MRRLNLAGALFAALLAAPLPAAAQLSSKDVQSLLDVQNHERCEVSPPARTMPALRWDARLAQVAQDHANACVVTHNRDRHIDYAAQGGTGLVGENIAVGHVSLHGLVSLWADEKRSYVFERVTASHAKQSGHYTQMIWANTTAVGCGAARCRSGAFLVCDYAPAGNILTQNPYKRGTSGAPTGACTGTAEVRDLGSPR